MKTLVSIFLASLLSFTASAQDQASAGKQEVKEIRNQVVEAACGECMFEMPGKGCDLAIRINGKRYFVDGTDIDDHGDAHGKDGFCNAVRKASVSGTIENNRFKATSFKLLAEEKKKQS
ncbi:MAG TPA: DUF6370 family protein [Sphingobacteriaceae bacterium]